MRRLKGLVTFIGGLVLMVLGFGMYRSPEINWEGFLDAWSLVLNDIARLVYDPFAVLGIVVLVIGLFIAAIGLRRIPADLTGIRIVLGKPRKR